MSVRQSNIAGEGTSVTLPSNPVAGNLLVVVACHRTDSHSMTMDTPLMTLVNSEQFATGSSDRRGIGIFYRISTGDETTFTVSIGPANPDDWAIGVVEFEGFAEPAFEDGNGNNSSTNEASALSIPVPDIPGVALLAVGGRSGPHGVSWGSAVEPIEETVTGRVGLSMVWAVPASLLNGEHVPSWSNDRYVVGVSGVWAFGAWDVGGKVTKDGVGVEGAKVVVIDSQSDLTDFRLFDIAETDANGDWEATAPAERVVHAFVLHEDGEDKYTAEGRPFIEEPEE